MKSGESKVALLALTEHIEMELLSSKDPCVVIFAQDIEQEHSFCRKHLEHPLVPDCEEEPTPTVQTHPRLRTKPRTEPPAGQASGHYTHVLQLPETVDIEMEIFPPFHVTESELVELKWDDPSVMIPPSPNKRSRLRWRRRSLQKTGLVVKDVVCLPRGHYVAHLDRRVVPQGKGLEALSASGMTARITIDCGWSASHMSGRLVMLFQSRFVKRSGRRFSFTYLQCVQGSRVLFVPDTPADGWTGEHVLRICGYGPLYIVSHLDCPQAGFGRSGCETLAVNGQEFCLEARTESRQQGDSPLDRQTLACRTTEELPLDLETILRRFRQENADEDAETHVVVKRRKWLHSALRVMRRPGFCFRSVPVLSFGGEEAGGYERPLAEFFRLSLLELQRSAVFEGHPGRLFITHDLAALRDGKYYEAGVLIGWSLAHGGPGPRCLHPALYQLMCGRCPSLEDLACTDIVDADVRMRLRQLRSCSDVKLLSPSLRDWVSSIAGTSPAHPDEMPAAYNRLAEHHICHRVASMISQFKDGLNSCGGLWDTIQANWELFVPVMTSAWQQQQPLTPQEFKQLFTVCYSRADSHRQLRAAEEATVGHWETALNLISGGQAGFSFEDLLALVTGPDQPPPLGCPGSIALRFYSQDASPSGVRLPHASSCALELFLPRAAAGAAELSALLGRAVREALGFTRFQTEQHGKDSLG